MIFTTGSGFAFGSNLAVIDQGGESSVNARGYCIVPPGVYGPS